MKNNKNNKKNILGGMFYLVIFIAIVGLCFPRLFNSLKFGLDLKGGFEVLYQVKRSDGKKLTINDMNSTYDVLKRNVDSLGVSEPEITMEGTDRIRVKLAGVTDIKGARKALSNVANISFRDTNDKLLMDSSVIKGARLSYDESGKPAISLQVADKEKFLEATTEVSQKESGENVMVIWYNFEKGVNSYVKDKDTCGNEDSMCLSAATVSQGFSSDVIITGNFEKEEAEVPNHLRDSSRDAEGFGHGAGYLYPHAYKDHWIAQQYLPDELSGRVFYNPSTQGYENTIRNDVLSRRELQIAAMLEKNTIGELYSSDELATSPETTGSVNVYTRSLTAKSCAKTSAQETDLQKSEFGDNPISQWWINEHFKSGDVKEENLTFSPKNPAKDVILDRADRFWQQRLDSNRAEILLNIRDTMISMANLLRHHRSLIWNADSGLLIWEIARKTPEGVTCGVCKTQKGKQILEQYGRTLGKLDRPILQTRDENNISQTDFLTPKAFYDIILKMQYSGAVFDRMFFTDPFVSQKSITALAQSIYGILNSQDFQTIKEPEDENQNYYEKDDSGANETEETYKPEIPLADGWKVIISQKIPCKGQLISEIIEKQILSQESTEPFAKILQKMKTAEQNFFGDKENPLFSWDSQTIAQEFEKKGFHVKVASKQITEKRRITPTEIEKWFEPKKSAYGSKISEALGSADLQKLINLLLAACEKTLFEWKSEIAFFMIEQ